MNSFTIYEEYFDLITLLDRNEQAELLLAITEYMFQDKEPTLNEKQMKIFKNLRRPLDISKKNSKRSKGNGAPVGNQNAKKTNQETNQNQTENKPKENQKTNTSKMSMSMSIVNDNVINKKVNRGMGEEEKEEVEILDNNSIAYHEIISYLNQVVGTSYRPTSKETQKHIKARLNDGFTIDDFKQVIDNMAFKWLKDEKMNRYLRPETLFGTKFESYLNETPIVKPKTLKDLSYADIDAIFGEE